MNEAIRVIEKTLLRPTRLRFMIFMMDKDEMSGMEIIDSGFRIPFVSEFIYHNLLKKKIKDGKKIYYLTPEGKEIAKAFSNLIDAVHLIVDEPEVEE